MTQRELRDSWGRALIRAVVSAVLAGVGAAVVAALLDGPWVYAAVLCGSVSLFVTLMVRGLVLLDAGSDARRR